MRNLSQNIGFVPSEFKLEGLEEHEDCTADVEIKESNFTHLQKRNKPTPEEASKLAMKNFPQQYP